ncbi:MAG: FAD-dependent oxidoreductase [Proteobacteria bacterium]|nr:FAD-dependent oxidoreductase [Pseudomonadota bacterium]
MARQLLFKKLQTIISKSLLEGAAEQTVPRSGATFSRRDFLTGAIALTAMGRPLRALEKRVLPINSRASEDNTIIVGAGVAGLVAAYRLSQGGVRPQLFEASERLGGRIFTRDKFNDQGMFCELGGELIDSAQSSIIDLCRELHVSLEDFTESDSGLSRIYYARQKLRTETELQEAAKPFLKIILKDLSLLYEGKHFRVPTYRNKMGPQVEALDRMSLVEYLQSKKDHVEGWLLDLIQEAYESEFGVTASLQSALNLLVLFDNNPTQDFKMYGASDESKRVVGGNSRLIKALEDKLKGKVNPQLGHPLVKIAEKGKKIELTFMNHGKAKVLKANRVILALPFSVLRDVEGIHKLNLSPAKKKSIAELGYGTDSKLIIGFKEKFWRQKQGQGQIPASSGTIFGDFPSQCFWETSRLQKGNRGILTALFGGEKGTNVGPDILKTTLLDLEKIYPDSAKKIDGNKALMVWPKVSYAKGSYSTPLVGQYTTLMGAAGETELDGRLLFAGEHCSVEKQGYMDGAVESGNTVGRIFFAASEGAIKRN